MIVNTITTLIISKKQQHCEMWLWCLLNWLLSFISFTKLSCCLFIYQIQRKRIWVTFLLKVLRNWPRRLTKHTLHQHYSVIPLAGLTHFSLVYSRVGIYRKITLHSGTGPTPWLVSSSSSKNNLFKENRQTSLFDCILLESCKPWWSRPWQMFH